MYPSKKGLQIGSIMRIASELPLIAPDGNLG